MIWLAEAFTKPAMMHTLGKVGFQQSLHLLRLAQQQVGPARVPAGAVRRRRGLHAARRSGRRRTTSSRPYMQYGGPAAWKLRAALAATLVPTYGIYAGYELMEHVARPGRRGADRQREVRVQGPALGGLRARRQQGRAVAWPATSPCSTRSARAHPALHWLRNLRFHHVDDENFLAFSKRRRLARRHRRHRHRRRQPRPARDPRDARCSSTCRPSAWLRVDSFEAHDLVTDADAGLAAATTTSGSGPRPNPCTSSP